MLAFETMGAVCAKPNIDGLYEHSFGNLDGAAYDVALWRATPPDFVPLDIRVEPAVESARTGQCLSPGELFRVAAEYTGPDGVHYLQLEDGRGWVYVSKPGVGLLARMAYNLESVVDTKAGYATWRCLSPDNSSVGLHEVPDLDGKLTPFSLAPGETFRVDEEYVTDDGMHFLKLEDGRGWTFVAKPNVGIFAEQQFWRYQPSDGLHMDIRTIPNVQGEKTGHILPSGEVFNVARIYEAQDGITYCKMADGRGWVFATTPDNGVLCVPFSEKDPAIVQKQHRFLETRRSVEAERKAAEDVERLGEAERKSKEEVARLTKIEADFRDENARLAKELADWRQRHSAESTAKQDAELRILAERRAKEDAAHRAHTDRQAAEHAKVLSEEQLRKEAAQASRMAEEEAERRAQAERLVALRVQEAEERGSEAQAETLRRIEAELRATEEFERRVEAEKKATEEAERRAELERAAELSATEAKERESQIAARQAQIDAERAAEAEQRGKEKEEHRAMVERLAAEVAEWQNRAESEKQSKLTAEARVESERTAKEEAERRVGIERLAASRAQDESERQFRIEAERKAREEVDRLTEAELKASEEAERFAEVERLAAGRARQAAERQLRVQAERLSFVPGGIPQPRLSVLGSRDLGSRDLQTPQTGQMWTPGDGASSNILPPIMPINITPINSRLQD